MKKLITAALVLVMLLSLAIPAFATDITFSGGAPGATYNAYKLLNVTDGGDGKYAYTLNPKYETILKTETGKTTENDIVAYISGLNSDGIRAFADDVYAAIVAAGLSYEYQTTSDVITGADQGYYLIAEVALGNNGIGTTDTWSLVMIDTVGKSTVDIVTKESFPSIEKEVFETNDSSTDDGHWGEHADYDVGDTIPYRITSTVSGQYERYINYWYQIQDTMDAGLTFNESSLVIKIGGVDVTGNANLSVVTSAHGFTITGDLKVLDAALDTLTITHNTVVDVTYTCTLNEDAKSGVPGNLNKVILRFQNNPYVNTDPTTPGETPEDTNIVFTYDSIVNKVDGEGNALAGAGFTLNKWISDSNEWVAVGSEITGVTTFSFLGLDAGTYKLVETTTPEGYNTIDPIEFEVKPVYDTSKDPVELTSLKVVDRDGDEITSFAIDMTEGEVETNVVNNPGSELPSTGGIGTTIFYILGSIMVVGAAVILVTKKRMAV